MKNYISLHKWFIIGSAVALGVLTCSSASAQSQSNKLRIGVYDSRAVAVAYANSAEFREASKPVQDEYQKAKTAKDQKRIKELNNQMKGLQRRMHEQGFSTGSVAGIMAKIKDTLPGVAQKAGVQVIVSKWEVNHQSPDVELVDVTDDLVAQFRVSEKGREWARAIRTKPPLPIENCTDEMD